MSRQVVGKKLGNIISQKPTINNPDNLIDTTTINLTKSIKQEATAIPKNAISNTDKPNWYKDDQEDDTCDEHRGPKGNRGEKGEKGDKGDKGDRGEKGESETKIVFSGLLATAPFNLGPGADYSFSSTNGVIIGAPGTAATAVTASSPPSLVSPTSNTVTLTYTITINHITYTVNATIAGYTFIIPQSGYIRDIEFGVYLGFQPATSGLSPPPPPPPPTLSYTAFVFVSPAPNNFGTSSSPSSFTVDQTLGTTVNFTLPSSISTPVDFTSNNLSRGTNNIPLSVAAGDRIGIFINGSGSAGPLASEVALSATITFIPR